jgi:deoxyguanosine kinase
VVTDFAPQQNLIFAEITVDALEFALYRELYDRLFGALPRPDRLICLDADLRTIMRRIRTPRREMETGIATDYLRKPCARLPALARQPPGPGPVD